MRGANLAGALLQRPDRDLVEPDGLDPLYGRLSPCTVVMDGTWCRTAAVRIS